ncbi:MAG: molybdopterin-dependent oxidoreductase [Dongiaceae bacterium]
MSSSFWIKSQAGFKVLADSSLEAPLSNQRGYFTPNDRFFVCNENPTPVVDASRYTLVVEGDAVNNRLELSYEELRAMEQKTVLAYLECAGNQRMLFETVLGKRLNKRPHMTETLWGLGGVGMAEWRGVPLKDVLERAGVKPQAVHVCPVGLDGNSEDDGVRCPMPVAKALQPETLLALEMNGQPLPPDHGFPVRVLVPGWVGTYSIKWVGRIIVSSRFLWVHRNTELYVLTGDDWPAESYLPAKGASISEQTIKSSLALDWPAQLTSGRQTIFGYARSPDSEIRSVQWSADGGASWMSADLLLPNIRYGWVNFSLTWDAQPGSHVLMTRATDRAGRTQPLSIPFNHGGYLFNMVHPHPVIVT